MNNVVLIGRLVKDPELRFTPGSGTAVTTCTLAVERTRKGKDGQREADFIPIVIWGKIAESTANYMSKGSQMSVRGRIQTRTYDAKDGTKRYVTEVVAEEVQFLSKSNGSGSENSGSGSQFEDGGNFPSDEDITPVDDGDMPF